MRANIPVEQAKDFDGLNDELDFLFNNFFQTAHPVMMPIKKGWKPPTDVYETVEEIVIIMDLAGITAHDIKVQLEGSLLIVRGVRREPVPGVKRHYHKMEIDFGLFERKIELPASVDPGKVTSSYQHGFLEIRLPKKQGAGSTRIEIEIG
jgi:HSP20 family protein